jgi:carbon-monoxide dehydrogenase large subunit
VSILGNAVVRLEDPRFLTGGGRFVDDIPVARAAHASFVRSELPHALITDIDTSAAATVPGVLGVFTAADLGVPRRTVANLFPSFPAAMERPLLAWERVRYVGEPIAVVVAESRAAATDAASAVLVDYEPLDAVVDPATASADGIVLFADHGTNVVVRMASPGTADFSSCDVVVELDIDIARMSGAPMEARAGIAWWEGERLVHHSSCQGAHPARDVLAAIYGLEPGQVRVVVPDVGGGFGVKSRTYADEAALGALARLVGRPVRWAETRSEHMLVNPHGRGQHQHIRIGGRRDGRVTAYQLDVVQDVGAYPLIGALLPGMTMRMLTGVYDLTNVGFTSVSAVTNTVPTTAFRGAGRPEATVAIERAMDRFAAELGIDPAEVRRRNFVPRFLDGYTTGIGTAYDVGDYPAALDRALDAVAYEDLRVEQRRRRAAGARRLLGIGIGAYVEITAGGPSTEHATVALQPDGRFRVVSGATPTGQGHDTTWTMIVADRTGIPLDAVDVVHGDTDLVPHGGLTVGSRSVQIAGATLAGATADLVEQARGLVAERLEAATADIVLDSDVGRFHVVGTPTSGLTWGELAATLGAALTGTSDFAAPQPTFPFGAHVAVVEVDADTGHTVLQRLVAVDDAGRLLNPLLAEGQIHGGIAQGVAGALLEAIDYSDDGTPRTTNFADYPVISAAELPSFEVHHMETPTFVNPLGAKGVGESGTIGALPSVYNAIVDAVSHLGVRHLQMPCTPERVWRAITDATTETTRSP